jgi:copper resistance protein C
VKQCVLIKEGNLARKLRLIAIIGLFGLVSTLSAHAVLEGVSPKAGSTVQGPEVAVELRFNSKIDGQRSRLELLTPDKKSVVLTIESADSPAHLAAHAHNLQPGAYTLRWQVLAVDGHITRGEVPFTVK